MSGTYKGRKFVAKPAKKNMEAVMQAMEDDTSAIEMLRRDVVKFQASELDTSREYLSSLRTSYDKLHRETSLREEQQLGLQEELAHLERLCNEARATQKAPNPHAEKLAARLDEEHRLVRDAQTQREVFDNMVKRLTDDVLEIKVRADLRLSSGS